MKRMRRRYLLSIVLALVGVVAGLLVLLGNSNGPGWGWTVPVDIALVYEEPPRPGARMEVHFIYFGEWSQVVSYARSPTKDAVVQFALGFLRLLSALTPAILFGAIGWICGRRIERRRPSGKNTEDG